MVRSSRQVILTFAIVLGVILAVGAAAALITINVPSSGGTVKRSPANEEGISGSSQLPSRSNLIVNSPAVPASFLETAKLVDTSPAGAVQLGFSVAISEDTAIVGAPGEANNRGSAFVFVRNGGTWVLQQEITGIDSISDDHFGWSVAISGETAAVGAYDLNEVDRGAAYIFVRNGLTWTQQQKVAAADGTATDQFGASVSISGDTVVVGAAGKTNSLGAAYVYVRTGSTWSQQQVLTAADGTAGDEFGTAVSISGETSVIGAPGDDLFRGGAYVFARNGTSWSQTAKIASADGSAFDRFASSVDLDGGHIVIGAPSDTHNGSLTGSAYVFSAPAGTWQQQQKLTAGDGASNDKFGESVAISGSFIAIGANGDDIGSNPDQGAVYIFTLGGSEWTFSQKIAGSDGRAGDNFGGSVSIRPGAMVGGSYLDDAASLLDAGSAFIFSAPASTASVSGRVLTANGTGLKSALVTIRDSVSGARQTVTTSTLGYFEFIVESGRDYVINVNSRRYRFAPVTISVNGDIPDLEFFGLE